MKTCTHDTKKELAASIRQLATGRTEWRVQHPTEKCYCISFNHSTSLNPERSAREWLAYFQQKFPNHEHAKYEVAEVHFYDELEEASLQAADALDAAPIPLLEKEHHGMRVHYQGLLKQARSALTRGIKEPGLAEMLRQLEGHLTELGQRWYAGDTAVVDEILQLYCVEEDARKALAGVKTP